MITLKNKPGFGFNEQILIELPSKAEFSGSGHVQIYEEGTYLATMNSSNQEVALKNPGAYKFIMASGTNMMAKVTVEDAPANIAIIAAMVPKNVKAEIIADYLAENVVGANIVTIDTIPEELKQEIIAEELANLTPDMLPPELLQAVHDRGGGGANVAADETVAEEEQAATDPEPVVPAEAPVAKISDDTPMQVNWGRRKVEAVLDTYNGDVIKLIFALREIPQFGKNKTAFTVEEEGGRPFIRFTDKFDETQLIYIDCYGAAPMHTKEEFQAIYGDRTDGEEEIDLTTLAST